MEKIKEIIVVEGRHDSNTLKQYFDCDTIETGGDQLIDTTIDRIARAQKERGVIIFTDPDSPGEQIRRWINERVPGCKNAFIEKKKAKTPHKVGVEHAKKEDLWESLSHCVTFDKENHSYYILFHVSYRMCVSSLSTRLQSNCWACRLFRRYHNRILPALLLL